MIDIDGLTREERLDLLERLWDSLTESQDDVPLWDWQRDELNRRLDEFERDGDQGAPAEDVLARLRGEAGCTIPHEHVAADVRCK